MNESSAREVLLLQAFESVGTPCPSWSEEDAAWATRLALQDQLADGQLARFVADRARHAMQRLLPREPALARWLAQRLWRPHWLAGSAIAGAAIGVLADGIGSSQRINLLAPPVWTVVAWNALVYLVLIAGAAGRALQRPAKRPGVLLRLTERLMRLGRSLPSAGASSADDTTAGSSGAARRGFAGRWLRSAAPLSVRRAETMLHVGAAALGLGLIAGMYARGLVLDYRASWESTFLSAGAVHALLTTLLAPASLLSGIALPDVATVSGLRSSHGAGNAGAPAAPWIHLYAWTLVLAVVLPRAALALFSGWRARRLASHFPLPLTDAYFQRLLRQQRGEEARVQVLPYAQSPGPQAALGLRRLLAEVLGDRLQCQVAATTAFGAEDDDASSLPTLPTTTTLAVALFDLSATPETENHGRFVRRVAATMAPSGVATILLVDEAAFRRRFGALASRLGERRAAWTQFAEALGSVAVIVDLDAPDLATSGRALQAAITAPVSAAPPG